MSAIRTNDDESSTEIIATNTHESVDMQDAGYPAGTGPVPGTAHERYVAQRLAEVGQWGHDTISDHVRRHAKERPERLAFIEGPHRVTWADFDAAADHYARVLVASGVAQGERVAVQFPDGATVHALYVGIERAGAVVVGIGPRAGVQEVRHLLGASAATTFITAEEHRGSSTAETVEQLRAEGLPLSRHVVVHRDDMFCVSLDGVVSASNLPPVLRARQRNIGELFMLNSTSGTTGMPKCVVHNQNRWFYYHSQVLAAGDFSADDVFLSLIPAPFGFGLWTAHFTPLILGCTTVVMARFDAEEAVRLIEREQVTVLNCVSTQFIMVLNSLALTTTETSSLRCMFTGGEAIPFDRAAQFEQDAGAIVLNFYGSNETGLLSFTTFGDGPVERLRSGGRAVGEMRVRLFGDDGQDVTARGGPGQASCNGPATSWGYYNDAEANAALFTDDGWMLTGDICTIDDRGYVRIVDRKSDFIIRGGKNISAAAVEEQVGTHPSVAMIAAIPAPDPVFGERVCAVIVPRPGTDVTIEDLQQHLAARQASKDLWPERLILVDSLPKASGGKVAKALLKEQLIDSGDLSVEPRR